MRVLKLAIISAVGFFLLLTLFTLLIPSSIRISRAIDINSPKEAVLPYLNNGSNWSKWNKYIQNEDHAWVKEKWQGEKFTIHLQSKSDSLVVSEWIPGKGNSFHSMYNILEPRMGLTTIQWYFDFKLKWYPWEKLGSIVYDKQLGGVMEESLQQLKEVVEAN